MTDLLDKLNEAKWEVISEGAKSSKYEYPGKLCHFFILN